MFYTKSATLMGDNSNFIMPSEQRANPRQNDVDTANDLKAWEWEDMHGYNKDNANEAFQLFLERELICIMETNISFESVGRKKWWTIRKNVTVQSHDIYEVPIQAKGVTEEDADRQCNLMILGELYRCQIIGPVDNEIEQQQYLPTDIQQNKITINTTNMNKFELPNQVLTSLPNTPTSGTTSIPVFAQPKPTPNVNSSKTFLGNIGARQNRIGGGDWPNARDEYNRFHPDLRRRKFAVQKKTFDEAIEEQCQVNIGPVRQASIEVHVSGGDTNKVNVEQIKIKSFNDLKLTPQMRTTLNAINYFEPTNLQKYVIPLIQHTGNDILCLAATGSGKSGAFLIPIVHRLQGLRTGPRGEPKPINKGAPLAIIVAHTIELIQQLYENALLFAHDTQVGVAIARGRMTSRDCREQLTAGCDILVITPGKLQQFLVENWIQCHNVQFVIIDEVDKFVDDDDMVQVIYKLREKLIESKNGCYRFLMFSATYNQSAEINIRSLLRTHYYEVVTANVNLTVTHVKQQILRVDSKKFGLNHRLQMLKTLLQTISKSIEPKGHFCFDTPKTIVFVNEGRMSDRVAIALSCWGFKAMSVNGHRSVEQRSKALEEFKKGQWSILVSTDVISRGLNLANIKYVVVYEMPPIQRAEQYIHRIGRVGRVGHDDGHAFVFFDPELMNDELLAEFLFQQLSQSNQRIPKFLQTMLEEKAQIEQMMKQQNIGGGMRGNHSKIGNNNNNHRQNNNSSESPVW